MYTPSHFEIDSPVAKFEIINSNSFATLISSNRGSLEISQLPFLLSEDNNYLLTHVAKKNALCESVSSADDLRVLFQDANAYISPGWYSDSQNVPTWNYVAVEVKGRAELMSNEQTIELLDKLSQKHEAQFDNPWTLDKLPERKLNAMVNAIVGIRISIDEIKGKAKLSQNKSISQRKELINGLRKQDDPMSYQIANLMDNLPDAE